MTTNDLSPATCPRVRRRFRAAGALIAFAALAIAPSAAHAQTGGDGGDYVTTTTAPERSLDVSAFSPECIRDAPYINYTIVAVGFVPDSPSATLVVRDRNGAVVDTFTTTSLSGRFVYPGASVDAQGNATDWPGWTTADDGSWVPDPSDAHLREGVTVEVTVNPTATAAVSYPAAGAPCANPPIDARCDPGDPACAPPCEAGEPGCTPCVPGQNNDGNPADDCSLPRTGTGIGTPLTIGAVLLVAGIFALSAARRNRPSTS